MKVALILKEEKNCIIWVYKYDGGFTIIVKSNEKVFKRISTWILLSCKSLHRRDIFFPGLVFFVIVIIFLAQWEFYCGCLACLLTHAN